MATLSRTLLAGFALVSAGASQVEFRRADGSGVPIELDRAWPPFAPLSFDADGDGDRDLVVWTAAEDRPFELLVNRGGARFARAMPSSPYTGPAPAFHVAGDFDGDSDIDVHASLLDRGLLWWNDGTGGFTRGGAAPTTWQRPAVAADFDRDGCDDILTGLQMLVSDGLGGMQPSTRARFPISTGEWFSYHVMDVDGDRVPDLAVRYSSQARVRSAVWRNDGASRFSDLPIDDEIGAIHAVADFDRDGRSDLVAQSPQGLLVLRGDGAGGFVPIAGPWPAVVEVTVGDFDGDLDIDLITRSSEGAVPVASWRNDAGGRFVAAPALPRGALAIVSLGDVDGVAGDDLLVANAGLLLGRHDGTFAFASRERFPDVVPQWITAWSIVDLDRDGAPDFLGPEGVDRNDGTGRFRRRPTPLRRDGLVAARIPWDFDADGDVDVLDLRWNASSSLFESDGTDFVAVHDLPWLTSSFVVESTIQGDVTGDGLADVLLIGGGRARVLTASAGQLPRDAGAISLLQTSTRFGPVAAIDVDRDGLLDFVQAGGNDTPAAILRQVEPGRFEVLRLPAGTETMLVAAGDLDSDGDDDVVCSGPWSAPRAFTLRNDGRGGFAREVLPDTPARIAAVFASDLDGDTDVDVLMSATGHDGIDAALVWWNLGSGQFVRPARLASVSAVNRIVDVDMDGDPDLIAVGSRGAVSVYEVHVNLLRQLDLPWLAHAGHEFAVDASARPGSGGAPRVVYSAIATAMRSTHLLHLGTWRLDMATAVVLEPMVMPTGREEWRFLMPDVPAMRGRELFGQGIVLDAERGFGVTNAVSRQVR